MFFAQFSNFQTWKLSAAGNTNGKIQKCFIHFSFEIIVLLQLVIFIALFMFMVTGGVTAHHSDFSQSCDKIKNVLP